MLHTQLSGITPLDVIYHNASNIDSSIIFQVLDASISSDKDRHRLDISYEHKVARIFEIISKRNDIPDDEIASREYAYFYLLENRLSPLIIHKLLEKDPSLYVSIASGDYDFNNMSSLQDIQPNPWVTSDRFLRSFREIPRSLENKEEIEKFQNWVKTVLELAKSKGNRKFIEQQIGNIFAHAPIDPNDQIWPHKTIRELIETLDSKELEKGMFSERIFRSAVSKGVYEGGKQEREFATQNQKWAEQCDRWPKTQELLRRIKKHWNDYARREDKRVKIMKMEGNF